MSKVKVIKVRRPFRSLKNYKEMHKNTAQKKGVLEAFLVAKTLTEARRILFG